MSPSTVQIIQLFVGSGIFILMLRITFQLGQYTNRLEVLERSFVRYVDKLEQIDRNVTMLLALNPTKSNRDG